MNDAKRLFVVELHRELVVLATNLDEAERLALAAYADGDTEVWPGRLRVLPESWDGSEIPYGLRDEANPDRTVREWIALGAAPDYEGKP